ncbi:MAG: TolC family protein, partial [Comamonas sp.]
MPDWQGKAPLAQTVPDQLSATYAVAPMDWPQTAWWQRYGNPELNTLIDEALQGAPDMAAAAARVRQAQALLGIQDSATGLQVSANASIKGDKLSYNHLTPAAMTPRGMNDYGRATLDLGWSLDLWGKQRAAVAAAAG